MNDAYGPGGEFRNVERALRLLTAFRRTYDPPQVDNQLFQQELRGLVELETPEETSVGIGRMVNGFLFLTSALVDALAERDECSGEEVMAAYRRRTEENITKAEGTA